MKSRKQSQQIEDGVIMLRELRRLIDEYPERLPCCFEYMVLHMEVPGHAPLCPPPGSSRQFDSLPR